MIQSPTHSPNVAPSNTRSLSIICCVGGGMLADPRCKKKQSMPSEDRQIGPRHEKHRTTCLESAQKRPSAEKERTSFVRGSKNTRHLTRKQGNIPDTKICARSLPPDGGPSSKLYIYIYIYIYISLYHCASCIPCTTMLVSVLSATGIRCLAQ